MNIPRALSYPTSQLAQTQRPTDTGIRLPYYYSSCSLDTVVEITLCEDPDCGRKTVVGMLLEYADGHHERVGIFRFDRATETLRVEHAVTLNLGVKKGAWYYVAEVKFDMTDDDKAVSQPKKPEPKKKEDGDEEVKEVTGAQETTEGEEDKAKDDLDSVVDDIIETPPDYLDVPLKGFLEWWFSCNSCKIYHNGVVDPNFFGGEDSSSSGSSSGSEIID